MKVLVACEESQAVCKAFREKGHEAYSADLQECSGGHPEWHIKGDCMELIDGDCSFRTQDGHQVNIEGKWDLLIAHPPCTYLSNLGAIHLYFGKEIVKRQNLGYKDEFRLMNEERIKKGIMARDFFLRMLNAKAERVAVENPIPSALWQLPTPTQSIQPYMFGDPYKKKTNLWLRRLPPILPTALVLPTGLWVDGGHAKTTKMDTFGFRDPKKRSKTFPGIAKAMADQWG